MMNNSSLHNKNDWFVSWFDSPYYHTLYKNRDDSEAQQFMTRLTEYLNLESGDTVLDVACGKGRHALFLASLGFQVTGMDLSQNSIEHASQFEKENLRFFKHDMRIPMKAQYDAVFNLFTSFGYFEDEKDDLLTLQSFRKNLKENGVGIIDFLNVPYVEKQLIENEVKTIDGIEFTIHRSVTKTHILKNIAFNVDGIEHNYFEKVRSLKLSDFQKLLEKSDLQIVELFGDYQLNPYHSSNSERLIMMVV
jgi:cyclopropane fatty-acyl-phospholipid synthase-like methyltransferase